MMAEEWLKVVLSNNGEGNVHSIEPWSDPLMCEKSSSIND